MNYAMETIKDESFYLCIAFITDDNRDYIDQGKTESIDFTYDQHRMQGCAALHHRVCTVMTEL